MTAAAPLLLRLCQKPRGCELKKSWSIAAVLGVVTALVLGVAPSANAALDPPVLPSTQTLYNIDCGKHAPQLWTFSTDGASTPVGSTSLKGNCAGGAQTSPVDGKTYFIYYPDNLTTDLATVDLTTGETTVIAGITAITGYQPAWQLIITNAGQAFITSFNNGTNHAELIQIDLTTAATTLVGDMYPYDGGATGYDSVTDTIYGFNSKNAQKIYTIDRLTGAPTDTGVGGNWPVRPCLAGGNGVLAPDNVVFDSNGIAWIQADSQFCTSVVMAWDPVSGTSWATGELYDATATLYPTAPHDYYSETFFISPVPIYKAAPVLAATGTDFGVVTLVGTTAAGIVLAGIFLLTRRRKTI